MSPIRLGLFSIAIFLSAFLLFIVQPMVGKHILPWFGGAPAVWNVCLAFYQLTLFAGYAYAHWLIAHVRPSRQLFVHTALFLAALFVLPVLPDASWRPEGATLPRIRILSMLAVNVGLPFLLLSATGPLLQAWFVRVSSGRSPYRLYAISNIGSVLALLSFPFLIEPLMPLSLEARVWSWLFGGCGIAILACGMLAAQSRAASNPLPTDGAPDAPSAPATRTWLWVLLPACAVVLFMGVTNDLCIDVASIPFLWIVPLTVYLLTFILCFGSERYYKRRLFVKIAVVTVALFVWVRFGPGHMFVRDGGVAYFLVLVANYLLMLFSLCMMIHGELFRLRPAPERLTQYYLCISGGGALGGLFVGILAPQLFSGFYELPLGIAASGVLMTWLYWSEVRATLLVLPAWKIATTGVALVALIWAGFLMDRPYDGGARIIEQGRNFFGVVRVYEFETSKPAWRFRQMLHGGTNHGIQYLSLKLRDRPTTYYGVATGIGFAMQRRDGNPFRVGVLGLGVGTIGAYGVEGDHFQFYEINSDVIRMSGEGGHFTYLSDSAATIEVIPGDGRLSLEDQLRNGEPQNFDLLVMDAFSGDAIPVHLVTVEAFQLYLQHLNPKGALVVNISNSYLDLIGVMFRIADRLGMHAVNIHNVSYAGNFHAAADWMIMSRDEAYIEAFRGDVRKRRDRYKVPPKGLDTTYPDAVDWRSAPLWTDDYSDLFSVLHDF